MLFCESDPISAPTSHKVSWGLKTSLIPIKDPWQHFMASHGTGPMSHFPLFSKISKLIEYSHVTPLQKRNFMLITIKKLWLLKNFILRSYSKIDILDFFGYLAQMLQKFIEKLNTNSIWGFQIYFDLYFILILYLEAPYTILV